nr:DUF4349 domain-containing protein [Candidatus Woesearchaeota archaeon]
MSLKNQFLKLKENWLLVLIVIIIALAILNFSSITPYSDYSLGDQGIAADSKLGIVAERGYSPIYSTSEDFSPEVKDRKITKTASLSSEVKRNLFYEADSKLKAIVKSSDSFILNENINKYDQGLKSYLSGNYEIKVQTNKYDSVITQLKELGEIKSFTENSLDITGNYKDLEIELQSEKERLGLYRKLLDESTSVQDKISLSDLIFNLERQIKYLEDALENLNNQVSYSTVYVTITEKRSEYADIAFVKFSGLVSSLVNSINALLKLVVIIIPFILAGLLIWWITKKLR